MDHRPYLPQLAAMDTGTELCTSEALGFLRGA